MRREVPMVVSKLKMVLDLKNLKLSWFLWWMYSPFMVEESCWKLVPERVDSIWSSVSFRLEIW